MEKVGREFYLELYTGKYKTLSVWIWETSYFIPYV